MSVSANSETRWEIRPFDGVGPLSFEMSRQAVRDVLGQTPRSFRKNSAERTLTDAFVTPPLHAYFDETDHLEFVEVGDPRVLRFRGEQMFVEPPEEVFQHLLKFDRDIVRDGAGFDCFGIGITVFVAGGVVQGVGVCRRDYAEQLKKGA